MRCSCHPVCSPCSPVVHRAAEVETLRCSECDHALHTAIAFTSRLVHAPSSPLHSTVHRRLRPLTVRDPRTDAATCNLAAARARRSTMFASHHCRHALIDSYTPMSNSNLPRPGSFSTDSQSQQAAYGPCESRPTIVNRTEHQLQDPPVMSAHERTHGHSKGSAMMPSRDAVNELNRSSRTRVSRRRNELK
jgi:hypothetical protein